MQIGSGANRYEWSADWAKIPDTETARTGFAHDGVAVTEASEIVAFHQSDRTFLFFDRDGTLKRSWRSELTEAHGITIVKEGGTEFLWVADNGRKSQATQGYVYPAGGGQVVGQVVKITLDGQTVMTLNRPDVDVYQTGNYMPTWVAVNEERYGGNGDVWVADGYGQSYVHRFTRSGEYVSSINGEEGQAGRFNCPHAIFVDRRKPDAELYIADRANGRVQVYDLEGKFKRTFGPGIFTTPSGFITDGDNMVVAELRARLAVLDKDDKLICYLGDNEEVCNLEGWPNSRDDGGEIIATPHLESGKFNSPHGIAVDSGGNIYVAEWLIGGRMVKLAKS